jgi:hypothetical protein
MTKLETIQLLLSQSTSDPEVVAILTKFAEEWSDEKILKCWKAVDEKENKGLKLVNTSAGEFEIEFYAPLCDFTRDAINYFHSL